MRRTAAIVFLVLAACGTPNQPESNVVPPVQVDILQRCERLVKPPVGRQVWQAIGANLDAIPGCRAAEDMTTGQAREQLAVLNDALVNAYAAQSRGQLNADARATLAETVAAYRAYVASVG